MRDSQLTVRELRLNKPRIDYHETHPGDRSLDGECPRLEDRSFAHLEVLDSRGLEPMTPISGTRARL
jgi:hypothetical protein